VGYKGRVKIRPVETRDKQGKVTVIPEYIPETPEDYDTLELLIKYGNLEMPGPSRPPYKTLAQRAKEAHYDDSQPRDDQGRWSSGGGGDAAAYGEGLSAQAATALRDAENRIKAQKVETAVVVGADGQILIDKSDGNERYVQFTREELGKMKGGVLTHNHPIAWAFSQDDVALAMDRNVAEVRVVTVERNPEGQENKVVYRMRPGPEGWPKSAGQISYEYSWAATAALQTAKEKYKDMPDEFAKTLAANVGWSAVANMFPRNLKYERIGPPLPTL
jgi:hypothetical protein